MPDRFGESDEPDPTYPTEVERHPESGWEPDREWAAEQRRQAIANCGLCDQDGYTPGLRVCDHVDYRPAAVRGRQLITQTLQNLRKDHT